jgi:hypothetical protein
VRRSAARDGDGADARFEADTLAGLRRVVAGFELRRDAAVSDRVGDCAAAGRTALSRRAEVTCDRDDAGRPPAAVDDADDSLTLDRAMVDLPPRLAGRVLSEPSRRTRPDWDPCRDGRPR